MKLEPFPKIFHLGTRNVRDILTGPVEITEKLDGSQFVFGKDSDGCLHFRSKGAIIYAESAPKMFLRGVRYVESIAARLYEGGTYYCEILDSPRHNTLTYGRVPKNHLYLFGYLGFLGQLSDGLGWYGGAALTDTARRLDIEPPNIINAGYDFSSQEIIDMVKDRESVLGKSQIEGVVVKSYKNWYWPAADKEFGVRAAKYVTEQFKEQHRGWKKDKTSKGKLESFLSSYGTEARWEKARQYLEEQDMLEGEPRDIGQLVKRVQQDVMEESEDDIRDWLWNNFKGDIKRRSVKGLPEWYKRKLALGGGA